LGDVNSKLDSMGLAPPSSTATMKSSSSMNSIGERSTDHINDNPDSAINRQDIAMGGMTPIAARESVVRYQMSTKEEQFTEIQHFTVYCATWNVNGQSPKGSVREWLSKCDEPPDLYAIGFQELDLSKEAFLFTESVKEDEWKAVVDASLHPKAKYVRYVVLTLRLTGLKM
jgi:phosphatidylinositol-bisphosphatase